MKIRVLGCFHGLTARHRTSCLQIDDDVVIEAGSIASGLELRAQARVDHVLLSRPDLVLAAELVPFAENVMAMRRQSVMVYSSPAVRELFGQHIFNHELSIDFTQLPLSLDPSLPVLQFSPFVPGMEFEMGRMTVRAVPTEFARGSFAFVVRERAAAVVFSGTTAPSDAIFDAAAGERGLQALFCAVTYPDAYRDVAHQRGATTPAWLRSQVERVDLGDTPILVYDMHPRFEDEVRGELRMLGLPNVTVLKTREEFVL